MTDLHDALRERVRSFEPEPGGLERAVRLRRRREIRRKVGVYATILLLATIGAASAIALRDQQRSIPTISPDNVGTLHPVWADHVAGSPAAPAIADGVVYVTADRLYAFPLRCPTADGGCPSDWTADIGTPPAERPVVAGGVVLVTSDSGLFAFDSGCSGPICSPMWTAPSPGTSGLSDLNSHAPERFGQFSEPAVANGTVYVAGGEGVYAFPLRCRNDGGVCSPSWIGRGLGSFQPPAIGVDAIYVATSAGLDVYRMTCPTRRCDRLFHFGPARLGGDPHITTIGSDVFIDMARVASDRDVRARNVAWIAKGLGGALPSHVAVGDGLAFMTASRLYAFPIDCGTHMFCRPAWIGPEQFDEEIQEDRPWSDPVASNGLVFASTDRPYAFAADCATEGGECQPLWVGPAGFASQPAVSATAVAVTYVDGRVVLFGASGG